MKSSTPSASSLCAALLLDDEEDIAPPRATTTKSVFSTTAFTVVVDHPKAKRRRDIIIIESRCADALFRLDKKIRVVTTLLEICAPVVVFGGQQQGRETERERDKKRQKKRDFCASLSLSLSRVVSLSPLKRKKNARCFFCALLILQTLNTTHPIDFLFCSSSRERKSLPTNS